jgi:hypothetical protein
MQGCGRGKALPTSACRLLATRFGTRLAGKEVLQAPKEKALPPQVWWCYSVRHGGWQGGQAGHLKAQDVLGGAPARRLALLSRASFASGEPRYWRRPELNKDKRDKGQAIPWQDGWIVGCGSQSV